MNSLQQAFGGSLARPMMMVCVVAAMIGTAGVVALVNVSDQAQDAALREQSRLLKVRYDAASAAYEDNLRQLELVHARRQEEELQASQTRAAEAVRSAAQRELAANAAELAALRAREAELRARLEAARKVPAQRIFGGIEGSGKAVQYVECRAGEVILQPQGIHVAMADIPGKLPGHLQGTQVALMVRPDGFKAFLAARQALERANPGQQIGHLPVESGWDLDFRS